MSIYKIRQDLVDPSAIRACRFLQSSRLLRLFVLALPVAIAIASMLVVPLWIRTWPRPILRAITEAILRTVLVAYTTLFATAVVGTPIMGWLTLRSWRRREHRLGFERGFLLSLACFISLSLLEITSAAWLGWMHRFPALPTRFAEAPSDDYRIVVLGGSSALGEPYRPWVSVGQLVAGRLQQAMPGRRFQCEILARLGASLENQHLALAKLKRKPSAVIIYSGHNEIAARFEEERQVALDEEPAYSFARRLYRATLNSPFCTLVYEIISKNRLDAPPPLNGRHELIDPPQCSPSEYQAILRDFRGRLAAIVSYCDQIKALPILIIPPANEADYEPSRSILPPAVDPTERRRVIEQMKHARVLEVSDPRAAGHIYSGLLERHPGFAEAHFRFGRLLAKQGRLAEAASRYLSSLDNDGLPIRCPAPFRTAYHEVARRHPRAILIDGRIELAAASPSHLLGDDMIQDTHHPTLLGYVTLASAVLREIEEKRVFTEARWPKLPLDPVACARDLAMDHQRWATACDRTSAHYKRVAGFRYDPTERLEKSRLYNEAAQRFRLGQPTSDLGLAGIPNDAIRRPARTAPSDERSHPTQEKATRPLEEARAGK